MSDDLARSYDDSPYVSRAFWYTHPDTLATVATLGGMTPAAPSRCRVLEVGCATGGNLLPMAEALPDSSFVGIDLSAVQIAAGQQLIRAIGLQNVRLQTMSILDVPDDFGQFDYIIAHGVYSWVPADVQRKLLQLCERHLSPQGVAYISYNTYPGWHLRQMAREMMLYHVAGVDAPDQRAAQAAALIEFVRDNSPADATAYRAVLDDEVKRLQSGGEDYIVHEFLDTHNQPLYFHQFVERAAKSRLQYLGEARQLPVVLSAAAQQTLAPLSGDRVRLEQYLDFLRVRMFRWSLLVHEELKLHEQHPAEAIGRLRIAAPLTTDAPAEQIDAPDARMVFRTPAGHSLASTEPPIKRAFAKLGHAWPGTVTLDELCEDAAATPQFRMDLSELLLRGFLNDIIELHVEPFIYQATVSERPAVTALTRLCAANGLPITNRRHKTLRMPEFERLILTYLDGSRDRAALLDAIDEDFASGRIKIASSAENGGAALENPSVLMQQIDRALSDLARGAMLIG